MKRVGLVSASFVFSFMIVTYGSTCDQPTSPHGSVIIHPSKRGKYQNGEVILFGCKQGFYLNGLPIITCNGDKWTQTQFQCLGICPEVRNILNGKVSHVTPEVGKAAIEFRCNNKSFQLIGRTRLECIDGRWNGKLPYCHKLPSCVRLQSPANGTLHSNDNSHSAEAKFTCFTGFDLFGASTLTCNKGVWSSRVPTCKAYCKKVRDPLNGYVFGSRFSHGQVVSFKCKHGYELGGDHTLRCVNGRWNSSIPQCKASCPTLGPVRGGVITHVTRKGGGEVEIKCYANYTLIGSSRLSCINGKWNDSIPSCKASCQDPGNLLHGNTIGDNFSHGQKVSYFCNGNYVLEGAPTSTCSDGVWSNKMPNCRAPCSRPTTPPNGRIQGRDLRHGQSVKSFCRYGYKRVGSSPIKCYDGKWEKPFPVCKGICETLRNPYKGKLHRKNPSGRFLDGDVVTFSCDDGYDLFGKKRIRCVDKKWDSSIPQCKASCAPPLDIHNGRVLGKYFGHRKTVAYRCNGDYTLEGPRTLTCDNGKWNSDPPVCRGKCQFPGRLKNGYTSTGTYWRDQYFSHGSNIEYACDSLYTMDGSSTLHCNDGAWNVSLPSCRASCRDPGYIDRGNRIGTDFSHGKEVKYECASQSYSLVGNPQLTCHDGKWDSVPPSCKTPCAPLPPFILNGKIHHSSVSHEAVVSFSCNSGFQLQGPQQIKCLDGKWNESTPSCKGVCDKPGRLINGKVIGRNYSYGSEIKFECDNGYVLQGSAVSTCRKGVWQSQFPECEECVRVGAVFWGYWRTGLGADNYWKAKIEKINATHVNYALEVNRCQKRSFRRTDRKLIIDKKPSIGDVSPNSPVIAHQFKNKGWYRTGTAIGTSRSSSVFVKFDDGNTTLVPLERVRLLSYPRFCSDVK